MPTLSETAFLSLADETLDHIATIVEDAADAADVDVEATRAGGIVSLDFGAAGKIIVNTQTPMREIWVAAKSGGFHYRWDGPVDAPALADGRWTDTRSSETLFPALVRLIAAQAGLAVAF